jgi:hypothetical protein
VLEPRITRAVHLAVVMQYTVKNQKKVGASTFVCPPTCFKSSRAAAAVVGVSHDAMTCSINI